MQPNANTDTPAVPEACAAVPTRANEPLVWADTVRKALMVVAQGSACGCSASWGLRLRHALG
jgi:hypothetical protein